MRKLLLYFILTAISYACVEKRTQTENTDFSEVSSIEKHRPEFHFTPDSAWMNDPNGMVFYNDTYHLFYQYYPDSTVWGPMHWGHAVSKDMISWEHKPVTLYPDELGYIFSGSAVFDEHNTSGLGTPENPPLVAIFTYHNPAKAKAGQIDVETQGIAFSLDNGETWEKYAKNPVLGNPGIRDFRDPKVRWYEPTKQWIMTLAAQDHIRFYSSPNLKDWKLESEFGKALGAHGGVWECPDLFPLPVEGTDQVKWVLVVNINPGGPNGGSGVQYFIGDFDGHTFTNMDEKMRWADYGPDDYAGVTWSNTGDRVYFIGWMSNWKYANIVPTERWRSATTVARELKLQLIHGDLVLCSLPVEAFGQVTAPIFEAQNLEIDAPYDLSESAKTQDATFALDLKIEQTNGFKVLLSNEKGNEVSLLYDKAANQFTVDRSKSGNLSFHPEFGNEIIAPRISTETSMKLKLVLDVASMEVFADDGSTVMTVIFFPDEVLDKIQIIPEGKLKINTLSLRDVLEDRPVEISEIDEECIFNNDFKGLTIEWLNELKITTFLWSPDINSALIPVGNDTVFLSKGGCYHFGISVELKVNDDTLLISDSTFLMQKALSLANEYKLTNYSESIKKGDITKLQENETKVWYEIKDDNEDDNLFYNGIEITFEEKEKKINLTMYYN